MNSKEIYQSIDLNKLKKVSPKAFENVKRAEKETKGFSVNDSKKDEAMKKLYSLLKDKAPDVLKDVKVKEEVKEVEVKTTKQERKKSPAKTKKVKKAVKKAVGKKKVKKPTSTPSTPKPRSKEHISTRASKLAKKEGISFNEARKKVSKLIKDERKKEQESGEKELDKLMKFINQNSFQEELNQYPRGSEPPRTYKCPYCRSTKQKHYCSAMNMRMG